MGEAMEKPVGKSVREWLAEGEALYQASMQEYQDLQEQLADLEAKIEAKREEINQVAHVVGKPPLDPVKKPNSVQIIERDLQSMTRNTVTKALTGRGLG
jgi:hypothetical protein